ncbi:MAG: hypothetical protein ACKO97_00290 [Actinomycetota bacterium]
MLEEMGRTGLPLSKLREPVERYAGSGEINTQVKDIDAVIARIPLDGFAQLGERQPSATHLFENQ